MTSVPAKPHTLRSDIVFTFVLALAVYVAWLLRDVLVMLYVSALFAVVLTPLVRATASLHIGRWQPLKGAAILFLLLATAGALIAFGFLAIRPVAHDMEQLSAQAPARIPEMVSKLRQIPFMGRLDSGVLTVKLQSFAGQAATYMLYSFENWAGVLVKIISGFVLTLYFLIEGDQTYLWVLSFVPPQSRKRLDDALQRAAIRMGKWLRGQASLMIMIGAASTTVYLLLDVRYAYALGVLTGLFNIVPVVGAAATLVIAVLVAAMDSWGRVLGVAIFFFAYLQIENSFLVPRIMRTRVGLPGLAILVALLLGFALEGVLGALVAVPTCVLVAVLLDEYLAPKET